MPFQIAKLDEEQCLVFGFANVSVSKTTARGEGGEEFFDLQNDAIPPAELEKAAYTHVLEFRAANDMHVGPVTGELVESIVFTPDKLEKFATDPATGKVNEADLEVLKRLFPTRWWVGYKMEKSSFAKVKSGEYRMFSIEGEADRDTANV
jgi:hypothetical protein